MNHKGLYVRGLSGIVYYSLVYWIKWRQPEEMEWGWKLETYASRKRADEGFLVVFWKIKTCKSLTLCQAQDIYIFSIVLENYIVESKFNLMLSHYSQSPDCKSNSVISKCISTFSKNDYRMCKTLLKSCVLLGLPLLINYARRNTDVCMWRKRGGKLHFIIINWNNNNVEGLQRVCESLSNWAVK